MKLRRTILVLGGVACGLSAQEAPAPPSTPPAPAQAESPTPASKAFTIDPGTKIPLQLLNSVSTKNAAVGDRVYLQTAFPIMSSGRIVIPPGSYVAGTVTAVKRAGKVKGRAELYVRFDSLTLANGVTRDFRSRMGTLDGQSSEELDRNEGKVRGTTDKASDAMKVGEAAGWGTMIGGVSSGARGAGIGAAAGAAAGLAGVMLSRGPDAVLERGTMMEMVLDRKLSFTENELIYGNVPPPMQLNPGQGEQPKQNSKRSPWRPY